MTATPDPAGVITPVLPLRQPPRRLLPASSTKAGARSAASASSFRSRAADIVVRAPISPSAIRVRHHDRHAGSRRRHHARAAAPPTTAPAPPSQLDEGGLAQRRERVVLPIARRRHRRACADLAVEIRVRHHDRHAGFRRRYHPFRSPRATALAFSRRRGQNSRPSPFAPVRPRAQTTNPSVQRAPAVPRGQCRQATEVAATTRGHRELGRRGRSRPQSPRPLRSRSLAAEAPKGGRPSPFAPVRTSTRQTSSCRESRHRAAVVEARPRAARRHVVRRP